MIWQKKESTTKTYIVSRKEGQVLMVSFARANPKALWQVQPASLTNHVFSVREEGERYALCLAQPGEGQKVVATFDEKFEAEEAKARIRETLTYGKRGVFHYLIRLVYAAALLWLAYILLGFVLLRTTETPDITSTTNQIQSEKTGVPLNADEVLTPPEED